MKNSYTWLLEVGSTERLNVTTHRERLDFGGVVYQPLPFQLRGLVERSRGVEGLLPETLDLKVNGDDLDSRTMYREIGDPIGAPLALRRLSLGEGSRFGVAEADYCVTAVAARNGGVRCRLKRTSKIRRLHFSVSYRVVRKLRRWVNEARSVWEELLKRGQIKSWPVTLNLNHTMVCNLRCVMCQQAFGVPQKVMDRATYRRVREELFDRVSVLDLTVMGDPFCVSRSFFDEILTDVDRFDLRLTMTTNATLFPNDTQLDRIVRLASMIAISFDGATKETFEKIRVGARWEATVENIERLNRARLRLPFHRRPIVSFNYVLMRSNFLELPLFVEKVKAWGGDKILVMPVLKIHPSLEAELLDRKSPLLRKALAEAWEKALRLGVGISFGDLPVEKRPLGFRERLGVARVSSRIQELLALGLNLILQNAERRVDPARRRCPFLWNKVYVGFLGSVQTCCHPNFIEVDDLKKRSFREIWNGRIYSSLRTTLNSDRVSEPCRDCHLLR